MYLCGEKSVAVGMCKNVLKRFELLLQGAYGREWIRESKSHGHTTIKRGYSMYTTYPEASFERRDVMGIFHNRSIFLGFRQILQQHSPRGVMALWVKIMSFPPSEYRL